MRKIKRKRNYSTYVLVACVCVFSIMGVGYGYLQQTLNINMSLSKKDQIIDITDDVVTTGDGLYEDQYETGRYVYRGTNPNNFIKFNNELWRIIAKEVDGTYKIVRHELLPQNAGYTQMKYDSANHRLTENNTYCANSGNGCGVFAAVSGTFEVPGGYHSGTVTEDSEMKEYLNESYYSTLTGIAKTQVQSHEFDIGAVQYLQDSGNDSIQKNIDGEKMYQWTGNVGLPNVSDVLRASTNMLCMSASASQKLSAQMRMSACDQNYLLETLPDGAGYWLINAYSLAEGDFEYMSSTVWNTSHRNNMFAIGYMPTAIDSLGARPSLYLKSSIKLSGGTGTETDPYIIEE